MNIKEKTKKIIGQQRVDYVKGSIKLLKTWKKHRKKKVEFNGDFIKNYKIIEMKGKNIFCGYYDCFPLSADKTKILYQTVRKNADTKKDKTEIYCQDLSKNIKSKISSSDAWCWQQGSRLRWSLKNVNCIYFNDVTQGKYCTKLYDIENRKTIKKIIPALYDISKDEKFGVSLNFSRLQRLRPGYGYDKLEDGTLNINAPKDDGLFYVNISNGEKKLLVSLYSLAKDVDKNFEHEHYINHVCISPESDKIMYFHLWTDTTWPGWTTRLCIYDIKNNNNLIIESKKIVSHYTWLSNNQIMITCADKNSKNVEYRVYNLDNKTSEIINEKKLNEDGHPTDICNSYFISDTYPNKDCFQYIFIYDYKSNKKQNIIKVLGDPRLVGEHRCDLHPKVDNDTIVFDTTFKKHKRSIIVVKYTKEGMLNGQKDK